MLEVDGKFIELKNEFRIKNINATRNQISLSIIGVKYFSLLHFPDVNANSS